MSFFIEKDGIKIIPASFYIKILFFLALIGLSVIALQPVQTALSRAISNIRTNFIGRIEAFTGFEISYSSIRPAFWGSFDIRNINVSKDSNDFLTVSRVRLVFSLRELIRERKLSVRTVQIDRPALRIDMEKDKDIFDLLNSFSGPQDSDSELLRQIAEFLPAQADYRIRNGFFSFKDGEESYRAENIDINIRENNRNILFDANFTAELKQTGILDRTIIVRTGINIDGQYLTDTDEVNAQVSFSSLTGREESTANPLFSIRSATVDFMFKDKSVYLSSLSGNTAVYFDFIYNTGTQVILAELFLNGFIPNAHINFSSLHNAAGNFLNKAITGSLSMKYDNSLDYTINLWGGNPVRTASTGAFLSDAFYINAYGNMDNIFVNDFCLNMSESTSNEGLFQGIVNFSGSIGLNPFLTNGTASLEQMSFTGTETINGVFYISSNEGEIKLTGDKFSIGTTVLKELDIHLLPSNNNMDIIVSGLLEDEGAFYLDSVLYYDQNHFEAMLVLDSLSLYSIAEVINPFFDVLNFPEITYDLFKTIFFDSQIYFTTNFSNVVYNVPVFTIRRENTFGTLSFSGSGYQITVSEGIFYIGEDILHMSASTNISNPMDLVFNLYASYLDISWHIEGNLLDRTTLIVQDPHGLRLYGSKSNTGAISGFIEGIDFPIPARTSPVYLNFYSTLRFYSRDFWTVDVAQFRLWNLNSRNGSVEMSVSGTIDQEGASFRNLVYSDNIGILAGSTDFSWDTNLSYLQFLVDVTDGERSGELYHLEGQYSNSHFGLKAFVNNIRLNRFLRRNETILATAESEINWDSINSFNARINLLSFSAGFQNNELSSSVNITLNNDELLINNLRLDYSGIRTLTPLFYINRQDGRIRANSNVRGFAMDRTIAANIDLNANFGNTDSWFEIIRAFDSFNGELNIKDIIYGDLNQDIMAFQFSGNENAISLLGGINNMLNLEMDREGNFYLGLSDPLPIMGSFAGSLKDGNIDAHSSNFYIDLSSLFALVVNDASAFNINGGYITGRGDVRGPILNPEFFASARCTSLSIQVPDFIRHDIRAVPFSAVAEGHEITYGPVTAVSGTGAGSVMGWLRFENWMPKNAGLDITVPRETPIPYNTNIANFLANGNTSGRLLLTYDGDNSYMELTGEIYINNAEMSLDMDEIRLRTEGDIFEASDMNIYVELTMISGPTVEFLWPNANSPILRANPEIGTVFNITADTMTKEFSLISDVRIRSGEINYLDRNFYIRQGSIIFRENETQFNPRLSARAEIRDRTDTGPVTISMIIDNQPLFSFEPRFESNPNLTQLEIYSILGHNLNTDSIDNPDAISRFLLTSTTDLLAQFVTGSDVLAQLIFFRQVERSLRNLLNLDMLSIRTRFLQNAVVSGASGLLQPETPVDRNYRVGNYFDNTTVFIGKYIGQDMFIQGTLTLKYDENRLTFSGLRLETDIGVEFQTPFFNIRWNFVPNHPQNWWVNDNSITLSWSKSF